MHGNRTPTPTRSVLAAHCICKDGPSPPVSACVPFRRPQSRREALASAVLAAVCCWWRAPSLPPPGRGYPLSYAVWAQSSRWGARVDQQERKPDSRASVEATADVSLPTPDRCSPPDSGHLLLHPPPSCGLTGMLFPPGSGRVIFVRDSEGQG